MFVFTGAGLKVSATANAPGEIELREGQITQRTEQKSPRAVLQDTAHLKEEVEQQRRKHNNDDCNSDITTEEEEEEEEEEKGPDLTCLRAKQIEQEERAQIAARQLGDRLQDRERVPLGNISGQWTLYSSKFLNMYKKASDFAAIDLKTWKAGELTIGRHILNESSPRWADVGAEFKITGGCDHNHWNFPFQKPEFASLNPIKIRTFDPLNEENRNIRLTLIGDGLLGLRVPADALLDECGYEQGHITFVGVFMKTEAQVTKELHRMVWAGKTYCERNHAKHILSLRSTREREFREFREREFRDFGKRFLIDFTADEVDHACTAPLPPISQGMASTPDRESDDAWETDDEC